MFFQRLAATKLLRHRLEVNIQKLIIFVWKSNADITRYSLVSFRSLTVAK